MTSKSKIHQLSGSHSDCSDNISLTQLSAEIRKLKIQLADLSLGLKYLADANLEISGEMESLFMVVKDAVGVSDQRGLEDDPLTKMMMPFFPKKDDDLLN